MTTTGLHGTKWIMEQNDHFDKAHKMWNVTEKCVKLYIQVDFQTKGHTKHQFLFLLLLF